MSLIRCDSGEHLYDSDNYYECPYCNASGIETLTSDYNQESPSTKKFNSGILNRRDVISGYEIIKEIGSGSTARVYSARKDILVVAIKVFTNYSSSKSDRNKIDNFFSHEINLLKKLDHAGVVGIIDSGFEESQPYIVMELMDQGNLSDLVELRGYLSVQELLSISKYICEAVDYIHANKIIHRDIKPSNILFNRSGKPVISDLGIAKAILPREEITSRIDTVGTTDFMAPEVLQESPHTILSDIYSLGLLIYYALSGRLPSKSGTIFGRCRDRVEDNIIPLHERNPSVNKNISDVVMKSISLHPVDRFSSAMDLWSAMNIAIKSNSNGRAQLISQDNLGIAKLAKENSERIDYLKYVWVPIVVAVIGLAGAIFKIVL